MKTNNILKTGFFAIAFAALSIGTNAQTLLPSTPNPPAASDYTVFTTTGGESVDSVTVGSRMPYKVDAQDPVTGLTFEYKWLFSTSPALTIQNLGGTNLTGINDYYAANEISVVMPTGTGGITINTNVRSLAGGVEMCAQAKDDTYHVMVVARPTIKWAAGGRNNSCAAEAVSIPLTALTGYKQFEVAYSINYYANVDKSGSPTTSTGNIVLTNAMVAGSTLDFPATTFSATGVYEITITGITDRISRKSLNMSLVASVAGALPGDAYNVYVYPAPTTKPLQHVKNM